MTKDICHRQSDQPVSTNKIDASTFSPVGSPADKPHISLLPPTLNEQQTPLHSFKPETRSSSVTNDPQPWGRSPIRDDDYTVVSRPPYLASSPEDVRPNASSGNLQHFKSPTSPQLDFSIHPEINDVSMRLSEE